MLALIGVRYLRAWAVVSLVIHVFQALRRGGTGECLRRISVSELLVRLIVWRQLQQVMTRGSVRYPHVLALTSTVLALVGVVLGCVGTKKCCYRPSAHHWRLNK